MKPSDIHFGKSLNENSIIDKLFGKKVTLINSIEDPNQKQEAELEIKKDAAQVSSFLGLWFSYTSLDNEAAYQIALKYLKGNAALPIESIPPFRRVIWDKLYNEQRLNAIVGRFKLESAITGE